MAKKQVRAAAPAQNSPIQIRLSDEALKELDASAARNGRSRNAEAVAILEAAAMNIAQETVNPRYVAFQMFLQLTTKQMALVVGRMEEHTGTVLFALKATLMGLLDGLGASDADPPGMAEVGRAFSKNFLDRTSRLLSQPVELLTDDEKKMVHAAKLWGLKPLKEGEK